MYETYNYLINYKRHYRYKNLEENYKKILICFSPVIPHFSNECLKDLKYSSNFVWPEYNEKFLEEDLINIVIQVNGKKEHY